MATPNPRQRIGPARLIVVATPRCRPVIRHPLVRSIGLDWLHTSHDTNTVAELAKMYQHETNVAVRVSIVLALPSEPTPVSRAIIASILKDPHAPAALLQAISRTTGKNSVARIGTGFDPDMPKNPRRRRVLMPGLLVKFGRKIMAAVVPLTAVCLSRTYTAVRLHALDALKLIGGQPAIDAYDAATQQSQR